MTIKVSEMTSQQKMGNTGAAPSAARNWDFAYTWNSGGTTFTADFQNITDTASAAASLLIDRQVGGSSKFNVSKNGRLLVADGAGGATSTPSIGWIGGQNPGFYYNSASDGSAVAFCINNQARFWLKGANLLFDSGTVQRWSASSPPSSVDAGDVSYTRVGANQFNYAGPTAGAGAVTSRSEIQKEVTAIADNTATAVLTVTIPNAAHSASILVRLDGRLGAGGAIGADEASSSICYTVQVARTAGVNAVAGISTAFGSSTAAVAGAATCTVTGTLSAISGAVGATNTFDIRITIARGSGSSANHKATVTASLLNANATGITIA